MRYLTTLFAAFMAIACYVMVLDKPYLIGLTGWFVEQPYEFSLWWRDQAGHRLDNPVFETVAYWPFLAIWGVASFIAIRSSWRWKTVNARGLAMTVVLIIAWSALSLLLVTARRQVSPWAETITVLGSLCGVVFVLGRLQKSSSKPLMHQDK